MKKFKDVNIDYRNFEDVYRPVDGLSVGIPFRLLHIVSGFRRIKYARYGRGEENAAMHLVNQKTTP